MIALMVSIGQLLVSAALAEEPQSASLADPNQITVSFQTDASGVLVKRITGRASGSSGGYSATATGYENVCKAPCSIQIPAGLYEWTIEAPGYRGLSSMDQLEPGKSYAYQLNLVSNRRDRIGGAFAGLGYVGLGTVGLLALLEGVDDTRFTMSQIKVGAVVFGTLTIGGTAVSWTGEKSTMALIPGPAAP